MADVEEVKGLDETPEVKLEEKRMKLLADNASWKDEMWSVIVAAPLALAFIPGTQGLAARGFAILHTASDWYVALVGVCVAYAFHRKVFDLFGFIRRK